MKTISILAAAAICTAPAFAQGDECTSATALTAGTSVAFDTTTATLSAEVWPCAAGGGPDLWFSYTTTGAAGDEVTAELCGSSYDTCIEIFSGSCAGLLSEICNDDSCGLQSSATVTSPGGGTTYYVRVGGYNGATGAGTILVTEATPPPTPDCLTADAFEPNLDCASATAMGDGTFAGLNVQDGDNDYYAVTLNDGDTITVDILFTDAFADVDLYLWDPTISCDTNVVGNGAAGGPLDYGFTASDDETATYTNTSGATMNIVIEVDMYTAGGCNDYDLIVTGTGGPIGPTFIGTAFCPGNNNSTGVPGVTTAYGFATAATNDVTLNADSIPVGQFGIFVTSMTAVPPVPVADGVLCLGGQIGRYTAPSMIWQADASGHAELAIDLTMTPQGVGSVAVMPGDTWYYQAWHRDNNMSGATSNFTTGIEVTYN